MAVDVADMLDALLFPTVCLGCEVLLDRPVTPALCGQCLVEHDELTPADQSFSGATALFPYAGPMARALTRLKYRGQTAMAGPLGDALAAALPPREGSFDIVVPVPLHWRRLIHRGFNQSLLLAQAAVRRAQHPAASVAPGLLRRVRNTQPQTELKAAERASNMVGAFAVPRRMHGRVSGREIVVIDDVVTTGSTLKACCAALSDAGATRVTALALLRTVA